MGISQATAGKYCRPVNFCREMTMKRRTFEVTVAAVIFGVGFAGSIVAGPLQEGEMASNRADSATVLRLWRPLADQGNAEAQFNLGILYELGRGVPQDDEVAANWYRRAADQGHITAQFYLGIMYANGHSVLKDYAAAVKWNRRAADQGYAPAQAYLGLMYYVGYHVPQDYAVAASWYRKAADQGYVAAQFYLGIMYQDGAGLRQDNIDAYTCFDLAAAEGNDAAVESRDVLAAKMTTVQIAEAQKRARELNTKFALREN
jgi:TPR repeat protein